MCDWKSLDLSLLLKMKMGIIYVLLFLKIFKHITSIEINNLSKQIIATAFIKLILLDEKNPNYLLGPFLYNTRLFMLFL